jgi:sugar O-acyltransferase (sialic acid O-acetyltransferase NeuD family)
MNDLYLIGGGGHCHSCIDVIEAEGKFKIKGIFDKEENIGKKILGYEVVATDKDLDKYVTDKNYFLVTVGQIKSAQLRVTLFDLLKTKKAQIATIVSPRAHISKHSTFGEGSIAMHDVLVNANAQIGMNVILNSKCLIEHDAQIGDHCHISTAAVINGDCHIEKESFVGSNSVLKEGITVKSQSVIPAGSFYRG